MPVRVTSPPRPYRVPQADAKHGSHAEKRGDGGRDIRIGHEQQPRDDVGPAVLFPAIHKEHEADSTRKQREEQPRRIERHRQPAPHLGILLIVTPNRYRYTAKVSFITDPDTSTWNVGRRPCYQSCWSSLT